MISLAGDRAAPSDRATVERTAQELILGMIRRRTPVGVSVVIEGAPGIGKTFLAGEILASVALSQAKVLRVAGQQGRRNDPFAVASQLLGDLASDTDPADAAFDHVDELCADGPVVLCADDAHHLDAASLTLLRRLVWASRTLPLAVLVTTRPARSREPLAMLIRPRPSTGTPPAACPRSCLAWSSRARSSCTCSSSPRTTPTASPMSPLKLPSAIELAGSPPSCPWQDAGLPGARRPDRACGVGLASPHD